jgi:hypothetical protein
MQLTFTGRCRRPYATNFASVGQTNEGVTGMSRWIVWGLWLSVAIAVIPSAATAGPKPLTPAQMDAVTAGWSSPISERSFNPYVINLTIQIAIPVAIAVSVCNFCSGGASASAVAIAADFNLASPVSLIGR